MFTFEINGASYSIRQTPDGYRWMPPSGTGRIFPTLFEAQADAIKTVQNFISVENKAPTWDDYHDDRRHDNDE